MVQRGVGTTRKQCWRKARSLSEETRVDAEEDRSQKQHKVVKWKQFPEETDVGALGCRSQKIHKLVLMKTVPRMHMVVQMAIVPRRSTCWCRGTSLHNKTHFRAEGERSQKEHMSVQGKLDGPRKKHMLV
jgi:hypothetical protein